MRIPAGFLAVLLVSGPALARAEGRVVSPPVLPAESPATVAKIGIPVAAGDARAPAPPPPAASPAVETAEAPLVTRGGDVDYREIDALLRSEEYDYRGSGRDPFAPLVRSGGGDKEAEAIITDPGVADLIIVGRAWGGRLLFALAQTAQGRGFLLREGDRVRDGRVLAIKPDGVTFSQTTYGVTRTVTLPIGSVEEERNER